VVGRPPVGAGYVRKKGAYKQETKEKDQETQVGGRRKRCKRRAPKPLMDSAKKNPALGTETRREKCVPARNGGE